MWQWAPPVTHSFFPHRPHHRRPSPRTAPHPWIRAKILRYQVSYPLPFMQPHLTPYLSRHENGVECEEKGMHPGESPCQLIQLTVQLPRHPGQWVSPRTVNAVKMAWTQHPMPWVPTTCPSMANRHEHECKWTSKTAKTTSNAKSTKTPTRTTPANVGSPPHLEPRPSPCLVKGCGCTQNVKAGKAQNKDDRAIPSLTATVNMKHPRKDHQNAYAIWPNTDVLSRTPAWTTSTDVSNPTPACTTQHRCFKLNAGVYSPNCRWWGSGGNRWHRHRRGPKHSRGGGAISSNITPLS